MRSIVLFLLFVLALVSSAHAQTIRGARGPHGHWLPAWVRVIDWDGQVFDAPNIVLDAITLCPRTGDGDVWSYEPGTGIAVIELAGGVEWRIAYQWKGYNTGAVTANPNTTGDQFVIGEQPLDEQRDRVFADGSESCVRHYFGAEQ